MGKKFYKLAGCLMSAVLTVSLAACGNAAGSGQESGQANVQEEKAEAKGQTTIKVFGWGSGAQMDAYKAVVEKFNKANTGVQATIEVVPSSDYTTKLNAMLAAGNAPDVLMQSGDFGGFYYRNGYFENLTPYLERDGINIEEILVNGIDAGTVWDDNFREALPFSGNSMAIAYNKDYFDECGVPYPTDDWTWEEFVETCKKLTYGEGENKNYAICYHWGLPSYATFMEGGKLYDLSAQPPVMMANDPDTIRGMEKIIGLMRDGLMADSVAAQSMPAEQRFFAGRSAMMYFFAWDVSNFEESIGDSFEWGAVRLPLNDKGEHNSLLYSTGYAMNTASDRKDAAWEFIKYACLGEEAEREVMKTDVPVLKSLTEEYGAQKIEGTDIELKIFMDSMENSSVSPMGGSFNKLGDVFGTAWNAMTAEGADIGTAMEQLQKDGQPVLDELLQAK